jgi:hypothetical protein
VVVVVGSHGGLRLLAASTRQVSCVYEEVGAIGLCGRRLCRYAAGVYSFSRVVRWNLASFRR